MPNLGVVSADNDRSFVVADIPGLIEGAHLGHGLGIQFLRHIERTRLLVHLVDVSETTGRDPVQDFRIVMEELAQFSEDLVKKPMLLVATKVDVAQDPDRLESVRALAVGGESPALRNLQRDWSGSGKAESRYGGDCSRPSGSVETQVLNRDLTVYPPPVIMATGEIVRCCAK